MDMLQDSMMLYAILTGITIVSYMAMGMKMTLGIVVGVMLGMWSQRSEVAEQIISTSTVQVMRDLSQLTSLTI